MSLPLMHRDYAKKRGVLCQSKETVSVQHYPEAGMGSLGAFLSTAPMMCRGGHLESVAGLEAKSSVTVYFNGATLKIKVS